MPDDEGVASARRPGLRAGRSGGAADDAGAVTVVAATVVGVICSVTVVVAGAAGILIERHHLTGATDAAALAAADAAAGVVPGTPCDEAERIAEADRARILTCAVTGTDAEIEATSTVGPFVIRASARAGQPPSLRRVRTGASKK